MKKKMVFHAYIFKEWADNMAYKAHFFFFEQYKHVFDEVEFILSYSENTEEIRQEIKKFEKKIIEIFDCSILFESVETTVLCEAKTFHEKVVEDDYDGLVFFAHSKGVTNVLNPMFDTEKIINWIIIMYYYNLEYVNEVEKLLYGDENPCFYGTLRYNAEANNFSSWLFSNKIKNTLYLGAFYWLNKNKLFEYVSKEVNGNPKVVSRWYAELYPMKYNCAFQSSHNDVYIKGELDMYRADFEQLLSILGSQEDTNKIYMFKNNIWK